MFTSTHQASDYAAIVKVGFTTQIYKNLKRHKNILQNIVAIKLRFKAVRFLWAIMLHIKHLYAPAVIFLRHYDLYLIKPITCFSKRRYDWVL